MAIFEALAIDSSSLDANQALASFRLSQCKPDIAAEIILTVFEKVKKLREKEHSKTVLNMIDDDEEVDSTEGFLHA
jgi:hypothetical protein